MTRLFNSIRRRRGALTATFAACAFGALVAAPGAFAATPIYNNISNPLPSNVPSVGFEATSTDEFGGQVNFDGTARHNPRLTVTMSSWGCQSGTWNGGDCSTATGAKFPASIRLNVYRVRDSGDPGKLIGAVTHTYQIPYRPSANYNHCTGPDAGKWWSNSDSSCRNGRSANITASLGSLDLPAKAIISVEYDTTHFGYDPIGEGEPCFGSSGGCPYDALNVGVGDGDTGTPEGEPTVGSQPQPDDAYVAGENASAYCAGDSGPYGVFRLDAGCWTGYQPLFKVTATD